MIRVLQLDVPKLHPGKAIFRPIVILIPLVRTFALVHWVFVEFIP